MKITKNRLRQIIKEELENVLNEDLGNLASILINRNKEGRWLHPRDWNDAAIRKETILAFSEMLNAAYGHWIGPRLAMGLHPDDQAALKDPAGAGRKLKELLSIARLAENGRLPETGTLDYYVPLNKTPDSALTSGLGREFLRGGRGGSTIPPDEDDDL